MIDAIIRFSVRQKLLVGLLVFALIALGLNALRTLPLDAVPDITNNQVQVVTVSPALAPQEVEQFITYPLEVAMANIPGVIEIRSISRFGLSVITVVFEERVPVLDARQYVSEQINVAEEDIPEGLGKPDMMPITTGLGEIYQYVLRVKPGYEGQFTPMDLRTVQDWIVKRQMAGIPGIIEISSFGGYLKQYEVALDPLLLQSYDISVGEVFEALARNNQNSGGSYIEKRTDAFYIRTEGMVEGLEEIGQIVVANRRGIPVLIGQVGEVRLGSPKRFGAMTMNGEGEAVGGIALMLKGANSSEAVANVRERMETVRRSLPEGIELYPYLDRSNLVAKTIETVRNNLLEGGAIVIIVLILLLGDWRAGMIVASVIPLAMLFALFMMSRLGVSANLMSLGAIDFGIVVDGAVIIVEGVLHALVAYHLGQHLSRPEMDRVVAESASRLFRPAVFGVLIILVVFLPIMTLTGIEGKMFRPMALTFSFAVLGAMILSLTYVPMMASLVLSRRIEDKETLSRKLIRALKRIYLPALRSALRVPYLVLGLALAALVAAFLVFRGLGAEFIPTLEEGDLAMQMTIQPGSSLQESIRSSTRAERVLLEQFPEVENVVSKIGTAEVPTDPMAIEDADIMILLKERKAWTSAATREALVAKMKAALAAVPGATFEFTQPIQLRFNELMTGAKTDIAVKIFGEDTERLKELGDRAAELIVDLPGAGDVRVEQTEGLPQLVIRFDRGKIAEYGLDIQNLNTLVRTAFAGEAAGVVFENERKFDLVVRFQERFRNEMDLSQLYVHLADGRAIPLSEVARARYLEGPSLISREGARRRIVIGVNVRDRDVASLVDDIQARLERDLALPAGYSLQFGGEFENLEKAKQRLAVAVPAALALIFLLLYFAFGKLKYALLIFTAVPLSAIGGVISLWVRGMPFSISAGVGFIALFGVAVLNGIVLISHYNHLRYDEGVENTLDVLLRGSADRLRPVLLTATVAALGFLPMALSTSNGAEVQKPLATVVIGGLITATLLTLFVLPVLYKLVDRRAAGGLVVAALLLAGGAQAQPASLTLGMATDSALLRHPQLRRAGLAVEEARLAIDAAGEVPPTEFNVGYGQFNTKLWDYQFLVRQPFSQLGANARRRDLAEAAVVLSEEERNRLEYRLVYEVAQRWQEWHYAAERRQILEQQTDLYADFDRLSRQQLAAGATSRLEQTLAANQLTQAENDLTAARVQEASAYRRLKAAAWIRNDFPPPTEAMAALPLPDSAILSDVLSAPAARQVEVAQRAAGVAERAAAPAFSVGYFNQSIRPLVPLHGFQVGMSWPIFTRSQRARAQQARLREVMAQQELERVERDLAYRRAEAYNTLLLLARQWNERGAQLAGQAESLRQLADQQLEAGEVNYFIYLQSLQSALQSRLDRLQLLFEYNMAVLQLEYLKG